MKYLTLLISLVAVSSYPLRDCSMHYSMDPAVTRFRRYIQIDTSKEENLDRAVEFLRSQAVELRLPFNVFRPAGLPVVVVTLLGSDPSLPTIMLNSHMDVVPAVESEWTYPPFSAYMDENGDIYGRGTQDTKDTGAQFMEVIRRLKLNNVVLKRTVHVTFMPDEETGGYKGVKPFLKTDAFKAMNVGFAIDEGIASPDNNLFVTYQDKRPWQFKITVYGEGGHGFTMPETTAMEKAIKIMNTISEYRDKMRTLVKNRNVLDFGGYSSININMVDGGYRVNVIPTEVSLIVDMRLSSESNVTQVERLIKSWIVDAGNDTKVTYLRRDEVSLKSPLDNSNQYWAASRSAVTNLGHNVLPIVSPATSDMLALRSIGIPAVGMAAKINTVNKVHAKDENINVDVYLKGINLFYEILLKLANLDASVK